MFQSMPSQLEPVAENLRRTFHPLKIARVIDETHDARSIVFEIPSHLRQAFEYRAGQFLTLEIPHDGVRLRRCYSLASAPETDGEHKVTVKRVTGGRVSNWLHDGTRAADYYLCGPGPFMDTVENALHAAGVAPERVHVERFVSPPDPKPAGAAPAPVAAPSGDVPAAISIDLNGVQHEVPYTPGKTILQVVKDAGVDAPYSCEEGFCGCCAALLLDGKVVMDADDALTPADKARGVVLTCQGRPVGAKCSLRFVEI